MFQDRDGEKEILLGNKQLLGIFFVLVILFVVLFGAGYMVGHTSGEKKITEAAVEPKSQPTESAPANGGETHAVSPDPVSTAANDTAADQTAAARNKTSAKPNPAISNSQPLGARRSNKESAAISEMTRSELEQKADPETPAPALTGHTYLQVAALQRAEAEKVAKILNKKGFRTHIAPKPGTQYYRVLVGPMRDAGDLASTRDALRTKGFREVFVQRL
jgi:cell division protein FtsN